ncbi:MAG: DEAD/DEAH box helicase [Chitinophagaceae bacterium]
MSFNKLQLIEPVLKALHQQGYHQPTPIQQQAIPVVLNKQDLLACAQTGTGKTAAFAIPVLQLMFLHKQTRVNENKLKQIQTLVLVPTRELALQVEESFRDYGCYLGFHQLVVFGGVSQYNQVSMLRKGVDILVATPGRLLDLIQQRKISLEAVKYFILDEADRMLDMGFVDTVRKIIAYLPVQRQTLFFSATMPAPILQLSKQLLVKPVKVEVTPPSSVVEIIVQSLYYVEKTNKRHLLVEILKNPVLKTVLVFTKTKYGADRLARDLGRSGVKADAIHGNKSQNERQRALQKFKDGYARVLVATDIAARGIDIDQLSMVINFDLPDVPETYVHRIGRTGRAGATGVAVSFCDYEQKICLADIQKLIGKSITVVKDHLYDVPMMHPQQRSENHYSQLVHRKRSAGKRYGRVFMQASVKS